MRIGVEAGEVLWLQQSSDLAVTGEAVNAAARLQQAARPGQVLVGERAARSCRRARLESAESVAAKGFPQALRAWRAVGLAESPTRRTPFVGRDEDLALLGALYRRAAADRTPELVIITGEAGIGKSRLAAELLDELRTAQPAPTVLVGRNPPYGRGIAFWALGEILRTAAGVGPNETVAEVRVALARLLAERAADDAEDLAGRHSPRRLAAKRAERWSRISSGTPGADSSRSSPRSARS